MNIIERNHVRVKGDGPDTVLLAHGFGCDQRVWHAIVPALTPHYRVVLFDYVGSGQSDLGAYDSQRYNSLHGYAQDILDVAQALDLRNALFVGHSVSSIIGALAAIVDPTKFRALAMLAPSPRYLNDPPDYIGGFERNELDGLLDLMEQNFIGWANALAHVAAPDDTLSAELADRFCAIDPAIAREFAATVFYSDHRADLERVPIPSLIVQCSVDDIAPVSVGEYMQEHLPRSTYRLLDAAGHMPHMSNPTEVTRLLLEYFQAPK